MLESLTQQACDMVHRDQFTQSLVILGLLEPVQKNPEITVGAQTGVARSKPAKAAGSQTNQSQVNVVDLHCMWNSELRRIFWEL